MHKGYVGRSEADPKIKYYIRYFKDWPRHIHKELKRLTHHDGVMWEMTKDEDAVALLAVTPEIIGWALYSDQYIAFWVEDEYRHEGIGTEMYELMKDFFPISYVDWKPGRVPVFKR